MGFPSRRRDIRKIGGDSEKRQTVFSMRNGATMTRTVPCQNGSRSRGSNEVVRVSLVREHLFTKGLGTEQTKGTGRHIICTQLKRVRIASIISNSPGHSTVSEDIGRTTDTIEGRVWRRLIESSIVTEDEIIKVGRQTTRRAVIDSCNVIVRRSRRR